MGGWTDGWMDRWMDGWVDGWMDGWMDGWVDGRMVGWIDGWVDEWLDGWMDPHWGSLKTPGNHHHEGRITFKLWSNLLLSAHDRPRRPALPITSLSISPLTLVQPETAKQGGVRDWWTRSSWETPPFSMLLEALSLPERNKEEPQHFTEV